MSHKQWNNVVLPKIGGVINLHNASKDRSDSLDFFLMTSSISGSVGVATESNYCAANSFLDAFAHHRLHLGLPATSIGLGWISEIGYLHEHPEIEDRLLQKGVTSLNEDDFLQIIDTALNSSITGSKRDQARPYGSHGYMLTGLEPTGLLKLRKRGFEGVPATFTDPRASIISASFANGEGKGGASNFDSSLPAEVVDAMRSPQEGQGCLLLPEATLSVIAKQFSNFLLTPVHDLDVNKPLAGFGIDSMLAAAIRSWFYRKFQVDVAFMTLISQTSSLRTVAQTVSEELSKRIDGSEP